MAKIRLLCFLAKVKIVIYFLIDKSPTLVAGPINNYKPNWRPRKISKQAPINPAIK